MGDGTHHRRLESITRGWRCRRRSADYDHCPTCGRSIALSYFTELIMQETLNFLSQHGLAVVTAAVFAEQIGLPLPAMPFLIAAGALVGTGQMTLSMAVLAAVLAALLGDQVWFELGHRRGRRVLNWLCRISLEPDRKSCV